ncbi:NAD(P)/FAD-dependent oxidoreductase [Streptomyces ipomoeae]|jgi:NADPH-dependent 2,4-dienoyl-CoA reductase/sulfur reductase-like enzyme|uniref:Pyridine nucleotide-disulfide oxidoreductase n=2 Tax=Streptomyces ipomoeae TaxID=103232 RepID=L1KTK4_9ACTN|nr:NAD(P)/FAD-dependent oxidoreductase [Streptomyces ipomoeae]EKX63967.1 pyridine nucleotide-disulfide oxidoreductase [Streptomyces ipomoeae 91-03]MDX2823451.1 NAD(P)/FAD-dependent oxidoreductase [Streptomyces ipomoeae]MDX2841598.1 NAD(P)/FAD-dependent oxidoreductase [Streptomyces ipomoeae]MDX2876017.1 NAD(P)/FAD-dependent oxidoreductase [Streptomyces ipomoeae]TQE37622.1 FAD-binding protein [Streptomyces ipomoeae]
MGTERRLPRPGLPRLAVIGAGPAGLAAALAAAGRGVHVTLVDSAEAPGGQFHRQPAAGLGARRPQSLHHQWRTWQRLSDGLERQITAGRVTHLPDHHVWCVERHTENHGQERGAERLRPFTVHALLGPEQEKPATVHADAVLLATGGYEKVLPFPGWTLPGVVTAGGAQAMLKGGLVVSGRTAVVAGTGPLLLPVATGLAAAGVRVAALVESADPKALVRRGGALVGRADKLVEGAGYAVELLRRRVRTLVRHTVVEAHGTERLEAVTVAALDAEGRVRPGTERRIPCDTLAVGHGMLPHTDLAESLGCRVDADGMRVWADDEQRTDVPGVWAAGEATGIGGAALSLAEGHVAGRSAAARLRGSEPDPRQWAGAARSRDRLRKFFAALDGVYVPPAHWAEQVTDGTVVCRCEEVTAGAIREAVGELGAGDVRTVKLLTRAGMGWCQGRMCGPAVAGIAGCPEAVPRRPFARPVPLGVLARAGETDD